MYYRGRPPNGPAAVVSAGRQLAIQLRHRPLVLQVLDGILSRREQLAVDRGRECVQVAAEDVAPSAEQLGPKVNAPNAPKPPAVDRPNVDAHLAGRLCHAQSVADHRLVSIVRTSRFYGDL